MEQLNRTCFLIAISILAISINYCAAEEPCESDLDCNNGVCDSGSSKCNCTIGFVSFNNDTCKYTQKNQRTAYWLSVCLGPFGADWFYLANGSSSYIVVGLVKLSFGLILVFGICFSSFYKCCNKYEGADGKNSLRKIGGVVCGLVFVVLFLLAAFTSIIWCGVDVFRIYINAFKDGNGVALKQWKHNPWW